MIEISEENAIRVLNTISEFWDSTIGFEKEDFLKEDNVIMMGRPPFRIDILTSISGVSFEEVFSNSKVYKEDDFEVRCIHINELIKNKKSSGRLKDLADAEMLEKMLRKRNSK